MSLGNIQCNECHRPIPHAERYLVIDEEKGVEAEEGKTAYYCVECALRKGYAYYKENKSERTLTFLP
ncbi:hypothetical protein ACFLT4_01480 [Chloroflexota bacterium]